MKDLILHICRWLLPLFGVTAVVSCQKEKSTDDHSDDPLCEYGTPVMEYRISGKVTDAGTGAPVKGIEVTYVRDNPMYGAPDIVKTAGNGEFVCSGDDFPSKSAILKFSDVDGADNAGEFQTKEVKVTLVRKEGTEDGWFGGVYEAENVLVELDLVSDAKKE